MKKFRGIGKYIYIIIASFLSIFPFIWMMIGATNTSKDVGIGKLTFGSNLINNIQTVFQQSDIMRIFFNSLLIAVLSTLIGIFFSSMAGYAFEIFKSKIMDRIFAILILSMMIPFSAVMIPLFRMLSKANLINTYASVILPAAVTAFLIFFFRQNTQSFPKELIEAARVDGYGEHQIFFKIYMPSMKSTYAAAGIITFMASWNNYLWPLIAINSNEKKTLPLIISFFSSAYTPDYGAIMVLLIIATIPTLLIFFLMQKHFVEGMVGSVK